jgi:hypothetical protein
MDLLLHVRFCDEVSAVSEGDLQHKLFAAEYRNVVTAGPQ